MRFNNNKSEKLNEVQLMVSGLEKYCSKGKQPVSLNGVTYTSAELVKKFEQYAALIEETTALHAKWVFAVAQERAEAEVVRPLVQSLRNFVANMFGEGSEAFLAFGFKPRKVGKRTVASKARAVAKRAATRASHHVGASTPVVNGVSNGSAHS